MVTAMDIIDDIELAAIDENSGIAREDTCMLHSAIGCTQKSCHVSSPSTASALTSSSISVTQVLYCISGVFGTRLIDSV
jgi:hypothetical protein